MFKRRLATLAIAAALFLGIAAPAMAQQEQDGLVNVAIGDVTIQDVNIGVAALLAVQACDLEVVDIGAIAVLGIAVDRSGDSETVCELDTGDVILEQN